MRNKRLDWVVTDLRRMHAPLRFGARPDQIIAVQDARPQRSGIERARQHTAATHDRDRRALHRSLHRAWTCMTMPSRERRGDPVVTSTKKERRRRRYTSRRDGQVTVHATSPLVGHGAHTRHRPITVGRACAAVLRDPPHAQQLQQRRRAPRDRSATAPATAHATGRRHARADRAVASSASQHLPDHMEGRAMKSSAPAYGLAHTSGSEPATLFTPRHAAGGTWPSAGTKSAPGTQACLTSAAASPSRNPDATVSQRNSSSARSPSKTTPCSTRRSRASHVAPSARRPAPNASHRAPSSLEGLSRRPLRCRPRRRCDDRPASEARADRNRSARPPGRAAHSVRIR